MNRAGSLGWGQKKEGQKLACYGPTRRKLGHEVDNSRLTNKIEKDGRGENIGNTRRGSSR